MKKSFVLFVCGICAFAAAGFPLNPSFTPEAVKAYKAKADAGDAEAQYLYSYALVNGTGVKRNKAQAFAYAKKAADQGYERALYRVGIGYRWGWGGETNATKAAECYARFVAWAKKAAEQGDADAQRHLGYCYAAGNGIEMDKMEAVKWYRKAAEQGCAEGQWELGSCYALGEGVEKNVTEAMKWYRCAAEQGSRWLQYRLGCMLAEGEGIEKDMAEAVKWYRKAAEEGNDEARCRLGCCYANGRGVSKDLVEAAKWFRKSAEGGNHKAQRNLGWCYANGAGVSRDATEAEEWYGKFAMGIAVLRILFSHAGLLVVLFVFAVVCPLGALVFEVEYSPTFVLMDLRMKRSRLWRLWYRFGWIVYFVCSMWSVVVGIEVRRMLHSCVSWMDSAEIVDQLMVRDRLYLSVVYVVFWVMALVYLYVAIRSVVRWRRSRRPVSCQQFSFAQYVTLQLVAETSVVLILGAVTAFVFSLGGCVGLMWLTILTTAVLIPTTLPTRKRYDRLLGLAKNSTLAYDVIYRESCNGKPMRAKPVCADETQFRAECAEKGWEILYLRCVGDTRLLARFNRWCLNPIRCPIHFGVSTEELCWFCEVMKSLCAANVPKESAIEFCAREAPNAWFRKRLQIVLERLRSGDDLVRAMEDARCVKAFPPLLRKAVRIGEKNGHLDTALVRAKTALSLSEAKRRLLLYVEGTAINLLIIAIAAFIFSFNDASFNAASFADRVVFYGLLAVVPGSGVFMLLCKRWAERNVKVKMFFTKWRRRQRESGKRQYAWPLEHHWLTVLLLVITFIGLPFGLEAIGEFSEWFHFPATAWVKGLWK